MNTLPQQSSQPQQQHTDRNSTARHAEETREKTGKIFGRDINLPRYPALKQRSAVFFIQFSPSGVSYKLFDMAEIQPKTKIKINVIEKLK